MVDDGLERLFIAVPLTEDERHRIAHLLRSGIPRGLPGRAVRPENWHLTLRFLGSTEPVARDRVTAEMDAADLGARFSVRWGGIGAFPRTRRATVLWLGLEEGGPALSRLAATVAEAVEAAGFPPEDRPFRGHLTLSRIRPHQDVTALVDGMEPLGGTMPVDRVVLVRSHLGRGGARYENLEEFPLA
jgi:2'-5' RNA ligase